MNKTLAATLGGLIVVTLGVWYWSLYQNDDVAFLPPTTQLPVEIPATHVYKDTILGFSITLTTPLSGVVSDSLYYADTSYVYTAMGPGTSIRGVKFTIPGGVASGTNLSRDSYVSVEYLEEGQECSALAFIEIPNMKSEVIREGAVMYSFASSTEAAAGNRYEEYVYVLKNSNPCTAVRYFVHFGAIENYDSDIVKAFNRSKLFADFDSIRKTLIINQ